MASTLGIDLSSKFIDLVLVSENTDEALHQRISLEGPNAFERTREVRAEMPSAGWYDGHAVYLVAIEKPFHRHGQDLIRLVQGAVVACIPRRLELWEITPSQWKPALGLPIKAKPTPAAFPTFARIGGWPQDGLDALGVALYARDLNAAGIAAQLAKGAA